MKESIPITFNSKRYYCAVTGKRIKKRAALLIWDIPFPHINFVCYKPTSTGMYLRPDITNTPQQAIEVMLSKGFDIHSFVTKEEANKFMGWEGQE